MNTTSEYVEGMKKLRHFYTNLIDVAWVTLASAIQVERIPGQPKLYAHNPMDVTVTLHWIESDDDDDPVSYLTACEMKSLNIGRGRQYAKRIAAARAKLIEEIVATPDKFKIRWRKPDKDYKKPTRQSRPAQYGTVQISKLPQVRELFSYLTGANESAQ